MLFVLVVTTTLVVTFLIAGEASYLLPIFITDLLLNVLIVFHVKTCFHFKLVFLLTFFFLKNGPSPASFSLTFGLFQTKINTILQQFNLKKCPSSTWHWDLNPRPQDRESPPITTRPGLPPMSLHLN